MVDEDKEDNEVLGEIPELDEDKISSEEISNEKVDASPKKEKISADQKLDKLIQASKNEKKANKQAQVIEQNKSEKKEPIKQANIHKDKKIIEISSTIPTMQIALERDIAMDFATKTYSQFERLVKAIILFGSSAKKVSTPDSDIDLIVIIDDVSVKWDEETIAFYREELSKTIQKNPYRKSLHINTVKLSTWWQDLVKGDPIVINVIRYGDPLIDQGGFFIPLKALLEQGKIKSTPEAIYTLLQRAPIHLARARTALLAAVDGYYWACVDSAHAAIMAAGELPASPEHVAQMLTEQFVNKKMLKSKYVDYYEKIHSIAKEIVHGKRVEIDTDKLDEFRDNADEFVGEMARIVEEFIEKLKEEHGKEE